MCFNAQISITTFIVGLVAIIIGLISETITYSFGLFYFSIIFMQFIEFLIWIYIKNDDINEFLSICASLLLHIQVFLIIFLLYFYNEPLFMILFASATIILILIIDNTRRSNNNYRTVVNNETKMLEWKYISKSTLQLYLFIFGYVILHTIIILILYNYVLKNDYFKFLLICYIIINIIANLYAVIKYYKYGVSDSIYCIFINSFSFMIIVVSIYKNISH